MVAVAFLLEDNAYRREESMIKTQSKNVVATTAPMGPMFLLALHNPYLRPAGGQWFYAWIFVSTAPFKGYNLLWHLLAIVLTCIIVTSGFDWYSFISTQKPVLRTFLSKM
jgi:hypothetical protein